jgi:carbon monoxide dehydrogenase subunit G
MRLSLAQALPATPDAIWPFITDPARMNLWSLARVDGISPGDGGDPGGVGALRRITVRAPGRDVAFEEVVEHAEPPRRFVYRVVRGLPLRDHRGEINVRAQDGGSVLTWDVDFDFLVPGAEIAARRVLDEQLRRSLEALAGAAHEAAARPARVSARFVDDPEEVPALEREAVRVCVEQRELADRLNRAKDPKYWFTRVYQYVTEEQLARVRDGKSTHRAWVLRLIPRFHVYYIDNLRRYLGDLPGGAESHWQLAFGEMDRARERGGYQLVRGLLHGVAAHIEDDLPRALAEVHRRHYAGRCDYVRFRADYLLMADIFRRAADRLMADLPRNALPTYLRVLDPVLPVEVKDRLLTLYYDVPRQRRQAFERGGRLAVWAG